MEDQKILKWARFVATKFSSNEAGWKYTRDLGDLVHIRFKRDYTGYNIWYKRFLRGLAFAWSHNIHATKGSLAYQFGERTKGRSVWDRLTGFVTYFLIQMRKDKNLPDGILNGNIVFWEEDGEYGALFGPTVGVKVLDFIEAEPENPHARAILDEMKRMAKKSFSGEESEDESS